jgi:acyl-CoA synthetase (AMP-forming)/AMP-acid ligase II
MPTPRTSRPTCARLAAFKVPVHIWFRGDDLPRDPAGKVLTRQLRDEVVPSN